MKEGKDLTDELLLLSVLVDQVLDLPVYVGWKGMVRRRERMRVVVLVVGWLVWRVVWMGREIGWGGVDGRRRAALMALGI